MMTSEDQEQAIDRSASKVKEDLLSAKYVSKY